MPSNIVATCDKLADFVETNFQELGLTKFSAVMFAETCDRIAAAVEAREKPVQVPKKTGNERRAADSEGTKPNEFNLIIYKSRPTRWDYFLQNPHGGGGGSSSYPSFKTVFLAGTRSVDWQGKDRIWVIHKEWDTDTSEYRIRKSYWVPVPGTGPMPVLKW